MIGAAAQGIENLLILRGDDPKGGDQPDAKPVFDFESIDLLKLARDMREKGELPSARKIDSPPKFFIGAADVPRRPDVKWSPVPLQKKIEAGADFIQTQFGFDLDVVRAYAERLRAEGITEKLGVIIGVGPIRSAKSARWMNENLFGVTVPEPIIARIEAAKDQAAEGRRVCAELIEGLEADPGHRGRARHGAGARPGRDRGRARLALSVSASRCGGSARGRGAARAATRARRSCWMIRGPSPSKYCGIGATCSVPVLATLTV